MSRQDVLVRRGPHYGVLCGLIGVSEKNTEAAPVEPVAASVSHIPKDIVQMAEATGVAPSETPLPVGAIRIAASARI